MNQVPNIKAQIGQAAAPKENPFLGLVEGYYLGAVLDGLHRSGLLEFLKNALTVKELASVSGADAALLNPLLAYLSSHGDWVIYDPIDDTYRVHSSYFDNPMATHLLDQYIGAYGPCLSQLQTVLFDPATSGDYIDRSRHAKAFAKASGAPPDLIDLILRLSPGTVLDVGCGSGGLLHSLADENQEIKGIGVDANKAMLDLARNRVIDSTADRLSFQNGEALNIAEALPLQTRDGVDVIIAQNVANEFFADHTIDTFLAGLSSAFPDRLLVVADYYGCLGDGVPLELSRQRRGALHDVAQIVSGQGIPPSGLNDWQLIYKRNDCTLLKASSIVSGGLHRFIHIVKV